MTTVPDAYAADLKRPIDSDAAYRADEFTDTPYFYLGPTKYLKTPAHFGGAERGAPDLDVRVCTCAVPMYIEVNISEPPVLNPNAHAVWDERIELAAHFSDCTSVIS